MYPVVGICPICEEPLVVTRLYCRSCSSALEGHFSLGKFYELTPEQLAFAEIFIRCEGKITRVEQELGMSYPTVRARLDELIHALGYEIQEHEPEMSPQEREAIIEQLASGEITSAEAVTLLKGE
jgi:hypothetical protein